jgi:hypothetical protein
MRQPVIRPIGVAGLALLACVAASAASGSAARQSPKNNKPKLTLRASPVVAFSPARIYLVAELRGGANDYEEFYCPTIEWDWGDDTRSESSYDCEPYAPGKSEIRRRYSAEHTYRVAGNYQIQFRLKKKDKVVAVAQTTVQIRPGVRDIGG